MKDDKGTRERFSEILSAMVEIFSNNPLSKMGKRMYFEALKAYPYDQVAKAFSVAMQSHKYNTLPKPADIIEIITGKPSDINHIAQIEASKVWAAIGQIGSYQSVVYDDPTTQAVIKLYYGGWITMCVEVLESEKGWFQKDFVKAYVAYHSQGIKEHGHLVGIVERDNTMNGHLKHIPEPIPIGDKKRALEIAATKSPGILERPSGKYAGEVKQLTTKLRMVE